MGLFDKLFGRKKQPAPSTSELARERLTLMLVHDRLKLTPDLLDRIKGELLAVISKYVEIDESGVDVELTHSEHSAKLVARMPVKRQRINFERDVLEPGMGVPVVAAAALARIHQSPAEVASAAASAQEAAAPPEASPAVAPASVAPAVSAENEAPAAAPAETAAAQQPAVSDASAAEKTAEAAATTIEADPKPPEAAQSSAAEAEAGAAPASDGTSAASAADESVSAEKTAPAATPTKG